MGSKTRPHVIEFFSVMLRIKVHTKSNTADYVALPGKSLRFILPGRHILAVSLIFMVSAIFMLPKPEFSMGGEDEPPVLSAESKAYLMAEQNELQVELPAAGEQSLENYDDFDIPKAMFRQPQSSSFSSLTENMTSVPRSTESSALKNAARALEAAVLGKSKNDTAAQTAALTPFAKQPEQDKVNPAGTPDAVSPELNNATASPAAAPSALSSVLKDSAEEAAQAEAAALAAENIEPRPQGVWYQQTVKRGDNLSLIFSYLNLPTSTLNKVVAAAKESDLFLQPGQKIQFLIDENNVVKEMVKPLQTSGRQVRFTRMQANDNFKVVYEEVNAHVDNPKMIARFESASMMPLAKQAAEAREKKAAERAALAANGTQKASAGPNANPARPRLVYGTIAKGENFKTFAKRIGLTPTEVIRIDEILEKKGRTAALKAGDNVRVLFNGIGTRALINAVAIDSETLGSISFYRNLDDKNFYEEGAYVPTAGIFRRFPLATNIKVNSKFNMHRRHPVTGKISPHKGVDFKAAVGTPVYAPADGEVTFAGYQRAAGYYIILHHANGYSTVYMHLSKIDVKKGDKIYVGQIIAKTGNTGRTTGPHLHYEIRINDRPVDPLKIDLPSSSHPNLAHEQREAFKSTVKVFKQELFNDALAKVD